MSGGARSAVEAADLFVGRYLFPSRSFVPNSKFVPISYELTTSLRTSYEFLEPTFQNVSENLFGCLLEIKGNLKTIHGKSNFFRPKGRMYMFFFFFLKEPDARARPSDGLWKSLPKLARKVPACLGPAVTNLSLSRQWFKRGSRSTRAIQPKMSLKIHSAERSQN